MNFYTDNINFNETVLADFAKENGISKLLAKILFKRGIDTTQKLHSFLNPTLSNLEDPFNLKGMTEAVNRIKKAVEKKEKILIFGDYDVDGICSTTVMYKFFNSLGVTPNYFLPNRYEDGYGINEETAKKVVNEFKPDLIVTVDCGISSYKEVEYIKSFGIDVIVTDHHEIPEILPDCIVIDPKIKGQAFSFSGLCGAGVAMKVVQAFVGRENLEEYLPIVAIATVADIVPLLNENRAIVKLGLNMLDKLPVGVKMLLKDFDKLDMESLNSTNIAFRLAPKLNAAGRMGDATIALKIFISQNKHEIKQLIDRLTEMNTRRQDLCANVYADCLNILSKKEENERAIILMNSGWDSGLLGITCARLADEFNRPTFLFSLTDGVLRGSARSIGEINIHKVLSGCQDLLTTFGGHSMAAGMTLKVENFEEFKSRILNYLNKNYDEEYFVRKKFYDEEILSNEITVQFATELDMLEPFGCDNPKPIFKYNFQKCTVFPLKNYPQHLSIMSGNFKMIAFNNNTELLKLSNCFKKSALVDLQLNTYKQKMSVKGIVKQLNFEGYNQGLNELVSGLYLKQISLIKNVKSNALIKKYDKSQMLNLIENNLNKSKFGTLIVVNSLENYNTIQSKLKNKNLNYFISSLNFLTNENSMTLGLDNFENTNLFDTIIITEPVLDEKYLNNFASSTIFVPENENVSFNLNLNRDALVNFYLQIKDSLNKIVVEQNEWNYFLSFKKLNKNKLSFEEFVAYIYTFVDLNLLQVNADKFQYQIALKSTEKTELNNSKFYNKLFALQNK